MSKSAQLYKESTVRYSPRESTLGLYKYINKFNVKNHNIHPLTNVYGGDFGVYFHWDDWLDFSSADPWLAATRKLHPGGECPPELKDYALLTNAYDSYQTKITKSMIHLYCQRDVPKQIFVAIDDSYIKVPVMGRRRFGVENWDFQNATKQDLIDEMSKIQTSKIEALASGNHNHNPEFSFKDYKKFHKRLNLRSDQFLFNMEQEIFLLKEKLNDQVMTNNERDYLKFLQHAKQIKSGTQAIEESFNSKTWVSVNQNTREQHLVSYPFIKSNISRREKKSTFHHMIRSWFQFAEAHSIISWLNNDALVGWSYNGLNNEWNNNIQIQLPVAQLHYMAMNFNRSLIIENPRHGNGKYYLLIAPTYTKHLPHVIEARLIDIQTGLYIDINSLRSDDMKPPKSFYSEMGNEEEILKSMPVHDSSLHWHDLLNVLSLRHTYFEGGSVYVPNNITSMLKHSKKKAELLNKNINRVAGYNFQEDINLWVSNKICSRTPKVNRFVDNITRLELTLEGACNSPELLDEYKISAAMINRHTQYFSDFNAIGEYDMNEMADLPYFRKDPWDYADDINEKKVDNDNWFIQIDSSI